MSTRPANGVLDELAIIITEAQGLADGTADAPVAIATIHQAAHMLGIILGVPSACARLTHNNGHLVGRYATAREALR